MAKANTGVKAPIELEKKELEQTAVAETTEKPQYKVPFISARINHINDNADSKIKAHASVTIGKHFAIHGLKVYNGNDGKGPRVMYPSTKGSNGNYYDTFHPISKEARETMDKYVLDAYQQTIEQAQGEQSENEEPDEDEEPAFEQTM